MCCSTAKWKREVVQDHKFDFVDVNQFYQHNWLRKLKYTFVHMIVLKSVLVYIADLWTAGILLIFNQWGSTVKPKIPFVISKWIFLGCIFMSFALLAIDMKKARKIVQSRDISFAFTNIIAYRYYTLRNYAHYCFFSQINNSRKMWDRIAFFVFFTFKGWKRLVFAELPRQAINAFTLYSILQSKDFKLDPDAYGDNLVQKLVMYLMAFTLLIFIGSALLVLIALILYFPLLCHIRGNLKEYCCHKVDKRIGELLKKKSKDRLKVHLREQAAMAKADSSGNPALRKKRPPVEGDVMRPIREPTLPQLHLVDDDATSTSSYGGSAPPPPYPYQNMPPPGMYGDRLAKSPEPYGSGGQPDYGQRGPYGRGAAGQRPQYPGRRNSGSSLRSEATTYSGYSSTTAYTLTGPVTQVPPPLPPIPPSVTPSMPPKRSYGNLTATQAAMNVPSAPLEQHMRVPHVPGPPSVSEYGDDYEEDPYGGTVEDYTSEYGDTNMAEIHDPYPHATSSAPPRQQYGYRPAPGQQPLPPPGDFRPPPGDFRPPPGDFDFRPPQRAGSPTPSVGSTSSRGGARGGARGAAVPSRYAHDQRVPRYNNYTQQGGRYK